MWRAIIWGIIILLTVYFISIVKEPARPVETPEGLVELSIVRGNTLMAIYPPSEIRPQVLGMLIEKIIFCESGGDSKVCNKKYGCRAGMGLFQLIPSTVEYCEKKLGKSIDPFNAEDNYECGVWLLENEGTRHWGDENTDWGSWKCWSN